MSAVGESCDGMTVREARNWAAALLADATETPRLDAEVLLAHALGVQRTALYSQGDRCLPAERAHQFTCLVRRRLAREPVAYLIGRRAFYDIELAVDRRVLIPRPETELLVDLALAWARERPEPLRVVDVGTGSGALAIVLARHLGDAVIVATDISPGALQVAAGNVANHGLAGRILLLQGDLLAPIAGSIDLIVANPPYVPHDRLPTLDEDVRDYEPALALDGGASGLTHIEQLLHQASLRLATPGLLLIEIDATQGQAGHSLASALWRSARVSIVRDYAGRDRVLRVELS